MDNLPTELKLYIFQYLDSFSIITLGNISNTFAPLSYDRKLLSNLHFYKDYRLTTEDWQMSLMHPLRQEVITSLNINCVYWISRDELRRCLCLPMLKSLYALDTTLSLVDICCSSSIKLNVLALTIKTFTDLKYQSYSALSDIKKLCVHYDSGKMVQSTVLRFLLHNCTSLEELWYLDLSYVGYLSDELSLLARQLPDSLKILVFTCEIRNRFKDYKFRGLNTVAFQCRRSRANVYLENIDKETSDIYNRNFYKVLGSTVWQTHFTQLRRDYPFGLHDAKKLVYKQETFAHINFEELSLHHSHVTKCYRKQQRSVLSILRLSNTKFLKKLSINTCIFNSNTHFLDSNEVSSAQVKSNLDELIERSPLIEELEIWECCECCTKLARTATVNPDMLRSIGKMSKLRKLAIEVPNIIDGKCILDIICQSCPNLISLKISFKQACVDVYTSLRYLRMLKDFRYQQTYLPLNAILKSLASHDAHKLERIVLKCDKIDMFSYDTVKEFLIGNPQLRLLYIRINEYSKADLEPISRYLNKFKLKQQIFIITNRGSDDSDDDDDCSDFVPDNYMLEMVQFNTSISVIDIFNDFH